MAITLAATAEGLLEYDREFAPRIYEDVRVGLEFEGAPVSSTPGRTGNEGIASQRPVLDAYDRASLTIGSVLQPYQQAFTPNLDVTADSISTRLQKGKVDILIEADDLEKLRTRWKAAWGLWYNKDPKNWTFAKWLYVNRVYPQILDDLNAAAWGGVQQVATPNVAGTPLQAFTGYRQRLEDYITAGVIVPIPTGPIDRTNAFDKIETFVDGIPDAYSGKGGTIYASATIRRDYIRAYRDLHGTGNGVGGNGNDGAVIDSTNINIVAINQMAGSQRLFFAPNGVEGFIYGTLVGQTTPVPKIRWEAFERTLKGLMEIHRFYDFERPEEVFVNDPA